MSARLRAEDGQVLMFVGVVLLAVLLGMCALAIDAGIWFKASRHAQGVADAAAMAAVQDLPGDPDKAKGDAALYASQNGGTLAATPTISTTLEPGDTITVKATEQAPTFFARVFGINTVTVGATASAQAAGVSKIPGDGIDEKGTGRPVPFAVAASTWTTDGIGKHVTLTFGPSNPTGSGNFGIVNFGGSGPGTPKVVAGWIQNGLAGTVGPGVYGGVPGNKFNAIKTAMATLNGKLVTMPVFSYATGSGNNLQYTVIGWAAFKIDPAGVDVGGAATTISGSFVSLDVQSTDPPGPQYFGVGHVKLTK